MSSPVYSAFDDELTVVELCEKIINLFDGIDWEEIKELATTVHSHSEQIMSINNSIETISTAIDELRTNTSDLPTIRQQVATIDAELESINRLLNTKASKTEDNDFTGFNYFVNEVMLTHLLDKDGNTGMAGQYLAHEDDGVKWTDLPAPEGGIDNATLSLGTNTDGDPIVNLEYTKGEQTFNSPVAFDKDDFEVVNNHMKTKGGGGTTVVANPTAEGTDTLNKLQVGETVYNVPSGGGGGGDKLYRYNFRITYYGIQNPTRRAFGLMFDIYSHKNVELDTYDKFLDFIRPTQSFVIFAWNGFCSDRGYQTIIMGVSTNSERFPNASVYSVKTEATVSSGLTNFFVDNFDMSADKVFEYHCSKYEV